MDEKTPSWTPALKATLDAVKAHMREDGVAPLLSELSGALGVSKVAVHKRLKKLRSLGMLDWEPRGARTIRLSAKKVSELLEY